MTLVTLRNLNTLDLVLGQDWQDIRDNFAHLAELPGEYQVVTDTYSGASSGWQYLDETNLNFTLETTAGFLVLFYGAELTGSDPSEYARLGLRVNTTGPLQITRRYGAPASQISCISRAFYYPVAAGDTQVRLMFNCADADLDIINPYIGAFVI
jgi:hypothetical protein